MSDLPIAHRITLPEPLSYPPHVRRDGRRGVAVGERSGQMWLLEIDPRARTCAPAPLPITVPRSADGKGWNVHQMSGSHALDRLLLWPADHPPRVYDLPSGQLVAELGRIPGRALCLSPDGCWAVCLDEGSGGFMELDADAPAWRETSSFHVLDRPSGEPLEELYLDHVDYVVAMPCEEVPQRDDHFWIAAACYGFVATQRVQVIRSQGGLQRVTGDTRTFGDLVYDPTEVLSPPGPRHVFVGHGYGTGLAALDPDTGEFHHCWIRGRRKQPYAFIGGVVPCGTAAIAWGSSRDGDFLWRVGQPPVLMPKAPGYAIALYPDALLCLSHEGGELLWCDLPEPVPQSGGETEKGGGDDDGSARAPSLLSRVLAFIRTPLRR